MSLIGTKKILFDADCPLCRNLAMLAARRGDGKLLFESWQEFQGSDEAAEVLAAHVLEQEADKLRVWTGSVLLEGTESWEFLLENYRDLKGLAWLAKQLGLVNQTAQALEVGGRVTRMLCWSCPSKYRRQRM